MLTDFQNFFTGRLTGKFATNSDGTETDEYSTEAETI